MPLPSQDDERERRCLDDARRALENASHERPQEGADSDGTARADSPPSPSPRDLRRRSTYPAVKPISTRAAMWDAAIDSPIQRPGGICAQMEATMANCRQAGPGANGENAGDGANGRVDPLSSPFSREMALARTLQLRSRKRRKSVTLAADQILFRQ